MNLKLSLNKRCYVVAALLSVMGWQAAFSQSKLSKDVQLDEVVVTGTGTEHLLKNAPVQTEVISGKMLRNFAGKSIQEILGTLTSSFDFNEDDMGSQMQMNGPDTHRRQAHPRRCGRTERPGAYRPAQHRED